MKIINFKEQSVVQLLTADDVGKSKEKQELSDRASQNVVFETAFFIGKLGRENVIVLLEQGVEKPSRLQRCNLHSFIRELER